MDLVIGDHVVFWNHLAYDSLTYMEPGPWRLENALLVDKNDEGKDLYEGHGAPNVGGAGVVKPGTREDVLDDLYKAYNPIAERAIALADKVEKSRDQQAWADLQAQFPAVTWSPAWGWIIRERDDRDENKRRKTRFYKLRVLSGHGDPELIGLRDPEDPTRLSKVKRPIESAKGAAPKPAP